MGCVLLIYQKCCIRAKTLHLIKDVHVILFGAGGKLTDDEISSDLFLLLETTQGNQTVAICYQIDEELPLTLIIFLLFCNFSAFTFLFVFDLIYGAWELYSSHMILFLLCCVSLTMTGPKSDPIVFLV